MPNEEEHTCTADHLCWTDPSLRSTPELWKCARCGRVHRWLCGLYMGEAPAAENVNASYRAVMARKQPRCNYASARAPYSWRTHSNRRRARAGLSDRLLDALAGNKPTKRRIR